MGKMSIKTKYGVGDDVWFIYDGREKHGTISSIEVKVKSLVTIKYDIKIGSYLVTCDECNVYPSLEVLLKKNKHIKR
jgi:hypothetical protein